MTPRSLGLDLETSAYIHTYITARHTQPTHRHAPCVLCQGGSPQRVGVIYGMGMGWTETTSRDQMLALIEIDRKEEERDNKKNRGEERDPAIPQGQTCCTYCT